MSSKTKLSESPLTLDYRSDDRTSKLAELLKKHADYVANAVIMAFDKGNVKDAMNTLQALYDKVGPKKVKESALGHIKRKLLNAINEERKDTDEKGSYKAKNTRAPSTDKDVGEILYHMDMGTRHMDVLQDYELVASHKDELASISTTIQNLAQRIRAEIQKNSGGGEEPTSSAEETPTEPVAK